MIPLPSPCSDPSVHIPTAWQITTTNPTARYTSPSRYRNRCHREQQESHEKYLYCYTSRPITWCRCFQYAQPASARPNLHQNTSSCRRTVNIHRLYQYVSLQGIFQSGTVIVYPQTLHFLQASIADRRATASVTLFLLPLIRSSSLENTNGERETERARGFHLLTPRLTAGLLMVSQPNTPAG